MTNPFRRQETRRFPPFSSGFHSLSLSLSFSRGGLSKPCFLTSLPD